MQSTLITEKSTHKVLVVPIKLEKHPNADTLSITKVGDYVVVVNTEEYKNLDRAAWLPPDSLVDISRTEFSFLDKSRIKAKKIRGIVSYGLMVPVPENFQIGDDVTEFLGVKHYDPDVALEGIAERQEKMKFFNQCIKGPKTVCPKYDVDSFQKYARLVFKEREKIVTWEKIHGESSKYLFEDGQQFCGSRTEWKRQFYEPKFTLEEYLSWFPGEEEKAFKKFKFMTTQEDKWWHVYNKTPSIKRFCEDNSNHCLYGEIYGMQKGYPYNGSSMNIKFAAFDILKPNGQFMGYNEFITTVSKYMIPCVPLLGVQEFNIDNLIEQAEGPTYMGNTHIREGIVVKPIEERWDAKLGRVCLKIVSQGYLLGKY